MIADLSVHVALDVSFFSVCLYDPVFLSFGGLLSGLTCVLMCGLTCGLICGLICGQVRTTMRNNMLRRAVFDAFMSGDEGKVRLGKACV